MIKKDIFVFIGTQDNLTCYYGKGRAILRARSSLDGERVKRDPAFKGFWQSGQRLKQASPLAAALYSQIPAGKREYAMYRVLTGEAIRLLKQGMEEAEIREVLQQTYVQPLLAAASRASRRAVADTPRSAFAYRPLKDGGTLRRRQSRKRLEVSGKWPMDRLSVSFRKELERKARKSPPGLIYLGRHEQAPKLKWYLREDIDDIVRSRGKAMDWRDWLFSGGM